MHQHQRRPFLACVVAALSLAACTGARVALEKRDDGILHLKCKAPLPECLLEAAKLCGRVKYAVLRAVDDPEFKGLPSDTAEQFPSSEAYVRCGTARVLGAENQKLLAEPLCPAPAPAPSAPAAPSRACIPGSTQACVGPAGCRGGQSCQPDGASYAPCDCGTAPSAPASAVP
jgi:hypothetical protein